MCLPKSVRRKCIADFFCINNNFNFKEDNKMSKAIGRIYGVGSRSPYGYETDYMKYLQGYNPYIYGGAEFVGAMITPMHLAKEENFKQKVFNALTDTINASAGYAQSKDDFLTNLAVNGFNALTDTINASAGYAQSKDDFLTNLAVNGIANIIGLKAEQLPLWRASARPLTQFGKKFIKQGINSSADKMKNMFYDDDDEDKY